MSEWKVVPVEPTPEMLNLLWLELGDHPCKQHALEAWQAALAAAPAAPAPDVAAIMALADAYRDCRHHGDSREPRAALRAAVERIVREASEDREQVIAAEKGWNDDVIELTERAEAAEKENAWFREAIKVRDAEDQRAIDVLKERAERAEQEAAALRKDAERIDSLLKGK